MAGKTAILSVDILADARDATKGFDDAAKGASSAAEKIDDMGGKAGDTASGLSALSGAMEAAGFGGVADAMNLTATAMDAAEGSTMLFKVAQESLSLSSIKAAATKVADTAATVAHTVAQTAASVATKAWAATQWLLNAAMTANPIGLIVAGILLLVGAIILAWNKSEGFRDVVIGAWDAIKDAAAAVWDWIVNAIKVAWDTIVNVAKIAIGIYVGIWVAIFNAAKAAWDWIVNAVRVAWDWIVNVAKTAIGIYVGIWKAIFDAARAAWDWIVDAVRAAIDVVVGIVEGLKTTAGNIWDNIKKAATTAFEAIKKPIEVVEDVINNVIDAIKKVIDWFGKIKIPDALSKAGSILGGIFGGGKSAPSGAVSTAPTISTRAGGRSTSSAGGVTINVNGALDPVAVARQLRGILRADERRRSGVVIA